MKKAKAWAGLMALCLCVLMLFGCAEQEPEVVEITLLHGWGTTEKEHQRMQEIYRDFEKEHPHIKLNTRAMISSEEVVEKLRNMLSVGNVPDLVFTGGYGRDSVYRFMVENETALDLMPYMEKDPEFAASMAPLICDFWSVDGKLYTVSDVQLAAGGYWYNEEIFEQAGITQLPKTWEELFAACDAIKQWAQREQNDVIPVQLTQESSSFLANALLLDAGPGGTRWVTEYEIDRLDAAELDQVLEEMRRLYAYDTSTEKGHSYRDVGKNFNEEKVAIYINGVWASKLIDENIHAKYACFPGQAGQSSACMSVGLGFVAGNTGDQKRMDASVEFLKYILRKDVQERILRETGQMPSSPQVQLDEFQDIEPRLCQAMDAIRAADRIIEVPRNFWTSEQTEAFQNHIFSALQGSLTTEEFLNMLKA